MDDPGPILPADAESAFQSTEKHPSALSPKFPRLRWLALFAFLLSFDLIGSGVILHTDWGMTRLHHNEPTAPLGFRRDGRELVTTSFWMGRSYGVIYEAMFSRRGRVQIWNLHDATAQSISLDPTDPAEKAPVGQVDRSRHVKPMPVALSAAWQFVPPGDGARLVALAPPTSGPRPGERELTVLDLEGNRAIVRIGLSTDALVRCSTNAGFLYVNDPAGAGKPAAHLVYDLADGSTHAIADLDRMRTLDAAIDATGRRIAILSERSPDKARFLSVYSMPDLSLLFRTLDHGGQLSIAHGGVRVATLDKTRLCVYDVDAGRKTADIKSAIVLRDCAFASDGKHLFGSASALRNPAHLGYGIRLNPADPMQESRGVTVWDTASSACPTTVDAFDNCSWVFAGDSADTGHLKRKVRFEAGWRLESVTTGRTSPEYDTTCSLHSISANGDRIVIERLSESVRTRLQQWAFKLGPSANWLMKYLALREITYEVVDTWTGNTVWSFETDRDHGRPMFLFSSDGRHLALSDLSDLFSTRVLDIDRAARNFRCASGALIAVNALTVVWLLRRIIRTRTVSMRTGSHGE